MHICGYEWNLIAKVLSGGRCPNCAGNLLKTHEQFIEEVEKAILDKLITTKKPGQRMHRQEHPPRRFEKIKDQRHKLIKRPFTLTYYEAFASLSI